MKILLALGSDPFATPIEGGLRLRGWDVVSDPAGWDAVQYAEAGGFDAALVGTDLPEARRLIERLRAAEPDLALMAIGDAPSLALKERLFDAGADDVLAHPVEADEIGMRARAVARRRHGHLDRAIRFGDLVVIPGEHAAVRGRRLPMTRAEFTLLEFMALRAGRVLDRDVILAGLFGGADEPGPRRIDVYVCRLRRIFADHGLSPGIIGTVWGSGWIMVPPHPPGAPVPSHRAEVKHLRRQQAVEAAA